MAHPLGHHGTRVAASLIACFKITLEKHKFENLDLNEIIQSNSDPVGVVNRLKRRSRLADQDFENVYSPLIQGLLRLQSIDYSESDVCLSAILKLFDKLVSLVKQKEVETRTDLANVPDGQDNQVSKESDQNSTMDIVNIVGSNTTESTMKTLFRKLEDSEVDDCKHNKDRDIDTVENNWVMVQDGKGTPLLKRSSSKEAGHLLELSSRHSRGLE
ncbi:hypothetical protein LTR70_009996, partial [Exophiala xenobiotica]